MRLSPPDPRHRTIAARPRRTALLVAVVAFAGLAPPAGAAWRPPVPGAVTRPFDLGANPFEAGRHRGVDLAASPGTTLRAPCAGSVAFAGVAGSTGRVVTLRCGRWRVTHLPLASIAVRAGEAVEAGEPLGSVAASPDHAGLHLGVRRAEERFGYTDPLRFLVPGRPVAPPVARAPRPPRPRPTPGPPRPPVAPGPAYERRPAPVPRRVVAPEHRPAPLPRPAGDPRPVGERRPVGAPPRPVIVPPLRVAAPRRPVAARHAGSNPPAGGPVAPWPVWVGLALVLAGAGVRTRGRRTRARVRVEAAGTVTR